MSDLKSLMSDMLRARMEPDEAELPKILPEAAVERLRDHEKRYNAPVPFAVGDLVTPIKESPLRGAGDPHIVVAINNDALPDYDSSEPGHPYFGDRFTIQIATVVPSGSILRWWINHVDLEPYVLPAE